MPRVETIEVWNVNVPGRIARASADKYRAMRKALLAVLPRREPGLTQAEMGKAVLAHLPQDLWPNGAKAMWWVKTVQLDLEARGLVVRDRASQPLRWRRAPRSRARGETSALDRQARPAGLPVARDPMRRTASAGCSGTPVAKKLGIGPSTRLAPIGAPPDYKRLLAPLPAGVMLAQRAGPGTDIAHLFVARREDLARHLSMLRKALRADAALWVSWPKKASGVPTTVTEDVIRELALPLGFVDVKVCAVSEVWSGLKLVVRSQLR